MDRPPDAAGSDSSGDQNGPSTRYADYSDIRRPTRSRTVGPVGGNPQR